MRRLFLLISIFMFMPSTVWAKDYARNLIAYMNNLQTCTPHVFKYDHPTIKEISGTNIIYGKKKDKCQVKYFLPNNVIMKCNHSKDFIKLAASEKKYQQAMSNDFKSSSEKEDSAKESSFIAKECTIYYNGKKLSLEKGSYTLPK